MGISFAEYVCYHTTRKDMITTVKSVKHMCASTATKGHP